MTRVNLDELNESDKEAYFHVNTIEKVRMELTKYKTDYHFADSITPEYSQVQIFSEENLVATVDLKLGETKTLLSEIHGENIKEFNIIAEVTPNYTDISPFVITINSISRESNYLTKRI